MNELDTRPVLRSSRTLALALTALLIGLCALVLVLIGVLVSDAGAVGRFLSRELGHGLEAPRLWQSLALGGVVLANGLLWIAAVWHGRQVFRALSRQDLDGAGLAARRTARALWVLLALMVLAPTIGTLVATWHNPPGQRALAISFDGAQISTLLAALLATFLSHGLAFGAELWRDHRQVI